MTPVDDPGMIGTVIIVVFVVVAALLLFVLVNSTVRQQRRYLRAREHLGGRLLTAQDEERAAIAREIHDDSVQRLVAIAARIRNTESPVGIAVAADLDQLGHDLRGLARGIHPAVVDHVGLDAALGDLASSFIEREEITVEYTGINGADDLTPPQRLALYRVAQEALGNVARHAGVDRATLELSCDAKRTRLTIADEGRGVDVRTIDSGAGIGVTSMRERLGILGGTLEVDSHLGGGTRIIATIPRSARKP